MSAPQKPFHLFVYGTLMDPTVFRAVLGGRFVFSASDADSEAFFARDAVLSGFKKISPDNTYRYAVPDPFGTIRGYLIGPLPGELMASLRKYEGRNYTRRTLTVHTTDGPHKAVVFLANVKQLEHSFGYEFHDPLKQEILLQKKIEDALLEMEREQLHTDELVVRKTVREMHGRTIRDIFRRHFEAGGISDYAIRGALKDDPLPDFSRIRGEPEARALAPNYLAMVVRQVLFNQFEDRIRQDFRYDLDRINLPTVYFERAISSLAALRMLNSAPLTELLVGDCLHDIRFADSRLFDYVQWAIVTSEQIYDFAWARQHVQYIKTHMGHGYIPLGAELEFSNIGHRVITDPDGGAVRDIKYDGFLYFLDFALDVLTWRLGGHIDDHHEKSSALPRRGFFELALGTLSIKAGLSKPITDDPWMLNQFIHEAMRFYDVRPHSLHISLQLRTQHRPQRDRAVPLSVLKCLMALGGDPVRGGDGQLRISRLTDNEIVRYDLPAGGRSASAGSADQTGPVPSMLFSDISRRRSRQIEETSFITAADAGRYVQQFKFLRLSRELNYEPIIMGLKGIQLALSPGRFLTTTQFRTSRKHRQLFMDLVAWGERPEPIPPGEIEEFIGCVYEGLMSEHRGRPAHPETYIRWACNELWRMLKEFNAQAGQSGSDSAHG